jgi:alpha-galactosidase
MGLGTPQVPPFSFRYGGVASSELLATWAVTRTSETEAGGVTRHRTMYVDPRTQLECILELQEYVDFPAAKWVVRLRNGGRTDTPPLEDIQALDTLWQSSSRTTLCFARGSDARIDDFQNAVARLPQVGFAGEPLTFVSRGGRPSTAYLPYFNLGDGETGVVIGIGWSGQWAASFAQDVNQDVRVRAGMEKTHLVLRPGEEVRTPSILVLFWQGEPMRGHNLLRQFILHHNAPRKDGTIVQAPLACATWGGQLSSVQVEEIERASAAGLPFELFWVDAGWFGDGARGQYIPEITGYWYTQAGNWVIDRSIHPDGLVEVSRAARAAGMGMMLWVEPERAVWGTRLTQEHPDWFLGGRRAGASVLLNLGEPEARQWATGLVSGLVTELDLAWYRQDFNMDCLDEWRSNDTPDRQGMTEIRYVEGLYAFWDELRRRHPGLMIDNCASGGRRLDLELLARSIPLWRSDYHCPGMEADPIGGQVHTMGLSYWIPLHGTSAAASPLDTYALRSNLAAALQYWAPPALATDPAVRDWCSTMLAQYQRARPFFYGDYYPLTKTSPQADGWAAIQMHRPDQEQGMMLLLRRTESPFAAAQLTLGGLDPSGTYEFTDADTGRSVRYRGKELLSPTTWSIDTPRASRLIFYRRVR